MNNLTLKRISTMFLAFVVAATMGFTSISFAANPDSTDVMAVHDVESGATVTAYQIIKEQSGKWVTVGGAEITFVDADGNVNDDASKNIYPAPTAAQIAAIAKNPPTENTFALTPDGGVYKASGKAAGMYLVLVSGTGATVYNPMIVSVDYDKAEDKVSAKSNFTNDAYAKSSTPTVDKKNNQQGNTAAGTTDNGTSAQVGDKVGFTITTTIPSYSDQYDTVVFNVSDKLDAGLTPPAVSTTNNEDFSVTVGGAAAAEGSYTVAKDGNGFKVVFASDYIKSLKDKTEAERKVVITYKATVNGNAAFNFDPNKNEAKINFSNAPTDTEGKGEHKDDSKIYTFGIDADLGGTSVEGNKKTHEVIKVDENGKAETQSFTESTEETEVENALAGATFELSGNGIVPISVTTSENGYMEIKGLKEGSYVLKETAAPAGYQVDPKEHSVVISATYNEDGTLASYTITIDGEATSTYKATYSAAGMTLVAETQETVFITNTRVPGLPSTGGIGTYIFIIAGALIMSVAAFAIKRRTKEDQ